MSAPEHASHHLSEAAVAALRDMRLGESLGMIVPEVILAATVVAVVVYDMFFRREDSWKSGVVALMGVGGAWLAAMCSPAPLAADAAGAFSGSYIGDGLTHFFRNLFLLASMFVILASLLSKEIDRYRQGEYYGVLITATLAMCLLAGANDIILFFIALETLSLCSYVLVGYAKGGRAAAEASLKYLIYGSVVSGVLLFGVSYLYGLSGTSNIPEMMAGSLGGPYPLIAILGLLMVLAGLFFKTSLAPFHVWTPDVYQGAPAPVTAFLSVASKAAGFAALARLLAPVANLPVLGEFREAAGGAISVDLRFVFGALAALTMTIGNFAALKQNNLKRLLAYSSIAHAGYMAMAFSNPSAASFTAMMAYLKVYLFMNLGFFMAVVLMENDANGSSDIRDFGGYGREKPLLGACLVLTLVALIGLPPTAGFTAKLWLFASVMFEYDAASGQNVVLPWHALLVIVALLNSVVSLAYYIRPAKVLFFDEPSPKGTAWDANAIPGLMYWFLSSMALLLLAMPLLLLFFFWSGGLAFGEASDAFNSSALSYFLPPKA